jgi:Rha family phage regulatory protein
MNGAVMASTSLAERYRELGFRVIEGGKSGNVALLKTPGITEMFGVAHRNVLRDIREFQKSGGSDLSSEFAEHCRPTHYPDSRGKDQPCFELTKVGFATVAAKYDDVLRFRLAKAFDALERSDGYAGALVIQQINARIRELRLRASGQDELVLAAPDPSYDAMIADLGDFCDQEPKALQQDLFTGGADKAPDDANDRHLDELTRHPYYDWLKDPRVGQLPPRTAADEEVLPRTKKWDSLSPRIRDNPNFIEPKINEAFVHVLAEGSHTPDYDGATEEDKPAMFMRDELPIGHSADSWRVWVSEQWFRLPLDLRQRWWRETDYGKRAPSSEMIEAIIAIALP